MNWKEADITEVCDIVGGKPAPVSTEAFSSEGIPFVRMKDLGRYHLTTNLSITDDKISYSYAKKNKLNEYSGESVPLIPEQSVPVIPGEYVPPIPEQSVPPFSCQIWC